MTSHAPDEAGRPAAAAPPHSETTIAPPTGTRVSTPGPLGQPPPPLARFAGKFLVLRGAVRELWLVFGAQLLSYFAYTVMNQTLALWLSTDLRYSDVKAGNIVMGWSASLTLVTVLVGSLTDAIGLRRTFLLGISVCIFSRAVMTASAAPVPALLLGLLPLAVGEALLGPVMVAGVRRYTTTAQRSISFSMLYVTMNMGILLGNVLFDYVRQALGEQGRFLVPGVGAHLSTYRTLFLASVLLSVPNLLLIGLFLRHGVEVTDEGVKDNPLSNRSAPGRASSRRPCPGCGRPCAIPFASLPDCGGSPGFTVSWRF